MLIGDQSLGPVSALPTVHAGSSENVKTELGSVAAPLSVQELLGICGRQVGSLQTNSPSR